jgi:hypothetical protein
VIAMRSDGETRRHSSKVYDATFTVKNLDLESCPSRKRPGQSEPFWFGQFGGRPAVLPHYCMDDTYEYALPYCPAARLRVRDPIAGNRIWGAKEAAASIAYGIDWGETAVGTPGVLSPVGRATAGQ